MRSKRIVWGLLRISLGWVFLWAFLDKTFGLGFTTPAERAWLAGGSPTTGFLANATHGPMADIFQSLAGMVWVDWAFMLGLLLIGLALMLGIAMRLAVFGGSLMMLLMYLAAMPPEHNPVVDDHIIYIFVLMTFLLAGADRYLGLGEKWRKSSIVRSFPILK